MAGDCGTEAYLLLLHFLKKSVRTHHRINLHCFTGNQYVLERWLEVFPRTYFGFTNVAFTSNEDQVAALRHLEEDRLLLETDAPYFPPEGIEIAAPCLLWSAAAAVAANRGVTPEHTLFMRCLEYLADSDSSIIACDIGEWSIPLSTPVKVNMKLGWAYSSPVSIAKALDVLLALYCFKVWSSNQQRQE